MYWMYVLTAVYAPAWLWVCLRWKCNTAHVILLSSEIHQTNWGLAKAHISGASVVWGTFILEEVWCIMLFCDTQLQPTSITHRSVTSQLNILSTKGKLTSQTSRKNLVSSSEMTQHLPRSAALTRRQEAKCSSKVFDLVPSGLRWCLKAQKKRDIKRG